jgi:hypothetical protein
MNLDQILEAAAARVNHYGYHRGVDLGVRFELPPTPPCACGGKYADSTASHSRTCCTRRTPGSTGYDLDVWLALTPENEAAVRAAQTPAPAAPPALDPMCCGGTAVRAECPYHRPGAA